MVEKWKVKTIAAKRHRNKKDISISSKKDENYDGKMDDRVPNQENNFYLVLNYNEKESKNWKIMIYLL